MPIAHPHRLVPVLVALSGFASPTAEAAATALAERLPRTNLMVFHSTNGAVTSVKTTADWQGRREEILAGMQQVMGMLPGHERRCALEATVTEETDCGDHVRRLVTYSAEPGSRVPAYLLIPKAALAKPARHPAVLALHQTHPAGQRVVVGLGNSPDDEYGVALVRRGFVVLAPPYTMLANYWPDLKSLGHASGTMKSIWDNIRALDYLETLPFVQTNGFGAIGHSLGGHNGIFTAAFDERIRVVVSSCGLDSFVDYYGGDPGVWKPERGWCQERYMPRLLEFAGRLESIPFDFAEVIGSLAPRTCFISAPLRDSNFRWHSVATIEQGARPVYELFGKGGNLHVTHPDCAHHFPQSVREQAYEILERALRQP